MQNEYSCRYKRFLRNFLLSSIICSPGIFESKALAQAVSEAPPEPPASLPIPQHPGKQPEAPEATRPQQSQPNRESRPTYVAAQRTGSNMPIPGRPSRNLPDLAESQAEPEVPTSEAVEPEQLGCSNEYPINFAMAGLRSKPFTPASLSRKLEVV